MKAAGIPIDRRLAYAQLVLGHLEVATEKYLAGGGEEGLPNLVKSMAAHVDHYTRMEANVAARKAGLKAYAEAGRADSRRPGKSPYQAPGAAPASTAGGGPLPEHPRREHRRRSSGAGDAREQEQWGRGPGLGGKERGSLAGPRPGEVRPWAQGVGVQRDGRCLGEG